MIDPVVRSGTAADVEQLVELEGRARAALTDQRGGDRWLATHAVRGDRWGEVLDTAAVLVATIDDVIIGYLVLDIDDAVATVDEVYVEPAARELGFGDALLEAALDAARAAGCALLEGETLPGDRDTKNLYERAGIKARLITVSSAL